MLTVAIANHKGGCGKTATAHALGAVLAERRHVLLIDADPQASLSGACGLPDTIAPTLADVFTGTDITRAIHPLNPHLAIVPASISLADVELDLVARAGRESVLKKALARVSGFDLALIDCPPGLGLMTLNGLIACNGAIVPTQPQAQDLRGLSAFLKTLDTVKADLNPGIELIGILPTFYSPQLSHHNAVLQEIKANGLPVLYPIGRSVRVAEASAAHQPVTSYAPDNPQAQAYKQLGRQIEQWLRKRQA